MSSNVFLTPLLIRKEHKAHSPHCDFVALKKPVEELTVEEFLKLQKERQKFQIVSSGSINPTEHSICNLMEHNNKLSKMNYRQITFNLTLISVRLVNIVTPFKHVGDFTCVC